MPSGLPVQRRRRTLKDGGEDCFLLRFSNFFCCTGFFPSPCPTHRPSKSARVGQGLGSRGQGWSHGCTRIRPVHLQTGRGAHALGARPARNVGTAGRIVAARCGRSAPPVILHRSLTYPLRGAIDLGEQLLFLPGPNRFHEGGLPICLAYQRPRTRKAGRQSESRR